VGNQVIGLDIGTHAVRAVELSLGRGRPVVRRMGQVALPAGAVVAGEVVVPTEVAAALRRLWSEAGFRSRDVVVGVANPRVVARMTELPDLPEEELRSSLPYQVQELIPIPVDEAELDFQVIDRVRTPDGQDRQQVLLVAAHRDMLRSLLAALDGANLTASRIDLIPFALIRALHDPVAWLGADQPLGGQEVIIGSGAGVTNIVVHENGIPRFVRTLPTGGSVVTEAIADDLGLEADDAEAVKRGVGLQQPNVDDLAMSSLAPLANEVAGSLDFHLAQAGSAGDLRRVILSGGGSRLRALRSILEDQLGVPVVDGDPYAGLDVSKVPLDPAIVQASADYFTVALGLALSGESLAHDIRRVSLVPTEVTEQRAERRQLVLAGAGVGLFAALLLGLSFARGQQVDSQVLAAQAAEDRAASLQSQVGGLTDIEGLEADIAARTQTVSATLAGDVAWTTLFHDVSAVLPDDVWLTSFTASRAPGAVAAGQVQFEATGLDQTSAARWLLRADELDSLDQVWLASSAKTASASGRSLVQFSSSASLAAGAASDRAQRYVEAAR
jgi:type IV pilus assembly protein PilM